MAGGAEVHLSSGLHLSLIDADGRAVVDRIHFTEVKPAPFTDKHHCKRLDYRATWHQGRSNMLHRSRRVYPFTDHVRCCTLQHFAQHTVGEIADPRGSVIWNHHKIAAFR